MADTTSDNFDPYYTWLGIPPEDQPPDHYGLLGIKRFEKNREVISNAMDQRITHIRSFQTGKRVAWSQKLLTELTLAGRCLLDPDKKAGYDRQLQAANAPEAAQPDKPAGKVPPKPEGKPPATVPQVQIVASRAESPAHKQITGRKPIWRQPILAASGAALLLLTAALFAIVPRLTNQPTAVVDSHSQQAGVQPSERVGSGNGPLATEPETPSPAPTAPSQPMSPEPPVDVPPGFEPQEPENGASASLPGDEQRPEATDPLSSEDSPDPMPLPGVGPLEDPQPGTADAIDKPSEAIGQPADGTEPSTATDEGAQQRRPVPEKSELEMARQRIHRLLEQDYAEAERSEGHGALAQKLLDLGRESNDEQASQYVLFQEAATVACQSGQWPLAFDILEEMAEHYQVDPYQEKLEALSQAAGRPLTKEQREEMAEQALQVLDQALVAGRFELAGEAGRLVSAAAVRLRDGALGKRVRQRRDEIPQRKKQWELAQQAAERLKTDPQDAQANLIWGKFLCLDQGQWDQGLPHLLKADDPHLSKAAEMEQNRPDEPAQQSALAELWWEAAQLAQGPEKEPLLARARLWYGQAAPNLRGLAQIQAQKRLEELDALLPDAPPLATAAQPPANGAPLADAVPMVPEQPPRELRSMVGRLRVNAQDSGMLLKYEPGARISHVKLREVLTRLGLPSGNTELEFVGLLHVTEAMTVIVRQDGGLPIGGTHSVWIDNTMVGEVGGPQQPQEDLYKLELKPGQHLVRWVVSGDQWETGRLSLTDAETGQSLTLYHNPQLLAATRRLPTRANIEILRN